MYIHPNLPSRGDRSEHLFRAAQFVDDDVSRAGNAAGRRAGRARDAVLLQEFWKNYRLDKGLYVKL